MLVIIAVMGYSRSHNLCKFQQLLTMFFRSCGLASKGYDLLNSLGICMNQRWVYAAVEHLAETKRITLRADITHYPWFGSHDNLNRKNKVFEQRLDNQSSFDSGTAGTIYVVKDPSAPRLSLPPVREKIHHGSLKRLTYVDIVTKDAQASERIFARAVHRVLSILVDAPDFAFSTYEGNSSSIFSPPAPMQQLPTGPEYATNAYMLRTIHQEEATYEGNLRVLAEWERQLKFDTSEKRKYLALSVVIIWIGDQLTSSRLRGLQKFRCEDINSYERLSHLLPHFGWFHLEVALHSNYHSQFWGNTSGRTLAFAAELLNRRGLNSTSVQGLFHHNMEELLVHLGTASFRDVWCKIAGVERLSLLRDKEPDDLYQLAVRIVDEYASTNAIRMHRSRAEEVPDVLMGQAILFNKDYLDYLDIHMSIKSGDVGALEDQLPRLFFRFLGGKNTNYQHEVLGLMHAIQYEWTDDLK